MSTLSRGAPATLESGLAASDTAGKSRRVTGWRHYARSLWRNRLATVGLCLLLIITLSSIAAPIVAPYSPTWQERSERLLPPLSTGETSGHFYVLGSDQLGRDILSRIIYGGRVSLLIGFAAVLVAAPLGVILGLLAGSTRRWVDEVVMRIADVQLAFPFILLAMAIVAVLGTSLRNLVLVLVISGWVIYARVVRGQALRVRELEFMHAATTIGCSPLRLLFRHMLPNVLTPVIVLATFGLASTILLESSLSFLGLGVQPPTPSWGGMLNDSRDYISDAWWVSVMPGLAIMLTVLSVNFLGDWLRDVLDPKEQTR